MVSDMVLSTLYELQMGVWLGPYSLLSHSSVISLHYSVWTEILSQARSGQVSEPLICLFEGLWHRGSIQSCKVCQVHFCWRLKEALNRYFPAASIIPNSTHSWPLNRSWVQFSFIQFNSNPTLLRKLKINGF